MDAGVKNSEDFNDALFHYQRSCFLPLLTKDTSVNFNVDFLSQPDKSMTCMCRMNTILIIMGLTSQLLLKPVYESLQVVILQNLL